MMNSATFDKSAGLAQTFCMAMVLVWLRPGVAMGGVSVRVETDRPENDFVVLCQWHSDFLNVHGGRKLVREKIFIVASGVAIDCGWSLFGDGPVVEVMHPFYATVHGCAYAGRCDTAYSSYQDDQIILRPPTIEQYVQEIVGKYSGDEFSRVLTGFLSAHFEAGYFRYYKQKKDINLDYFKATYNQRLRTFWRQIKKFEGAYMKNFDPDVVADAYWKKAE